MKHPRILRFWLFAISVIALFMGVFALPRTATAANPITMSFQGKVVNANGTNVADGTYGFVFKLYSAASGGSALWTESQASVTVAAGIFQVNLGSSCSFFTANACNNNTPIDFSTANSLYMGITFNSDPAGEMTPRVQLQSVPFAYQADNASNLGGRAASGFVQLSPTGQQTGFINVSGDGTYGGNLAVTGTYDGNTFNSTTLTFSGASANSIKGTSGQTLTIQSQGSGGLTLQSATGAVSLGTSTSITNTTGGLALTAGGTAQTLTLNAATSGKIFIGSVSSGDVEIAGQGTGNILLGGGSGTTGCTVTNSSGALACAAGITALTGGVTATAGNVNAVAGTVQTANTDRIDNGGNLTNIGTITAANSTFNVNASGDQTTAFQQLDGTSTANGGSIGTSTSLTLTSAANFDIGNYVRVTSANCGGTGISPCYAKITAKATNTLTITPALTWANGSAVVEFHIPEIGGVDTAQTLANRYGRGYFIAGVATGNGTTYYSEEGISTSLASFDVANSPSVATLNLGNTNTTTINLGGTGTTTNITGALSVTGNVSAGSNALQGGSINIASGKFTVSNTGVVVALGTINTATISGGSLSGTAVNGLNVASGTINGATFTGTLTGSGTPTITGFGTINGSTLNGGSLSATAVNGLNVSGGTIASGTLSNPTISGTVTGSGTPTITGFGTYNTATISGGSLTGGSVSGSTLTSSGLTFTAAGAALVQPASGQQLNITAHAASTFATDAGTLTIQGGSGTVSLGTSTTLTNTSGGLAINPGTSGALTVAASNLTISSGGNLSAGGTLTAATGLTVTSGGSTVTGLSTVNGNLLVQQASTGAALILNRSDGVIGSLKSGSNKVAFFFDETGSFTISKDARASILGGAGSGTGDLLTVLPSGNVGIGTTSPAALLSVGASNQFGVSSTGLITTTGGATITGGASITAGATGDALTLSNGSSTGNILTLTDNTTTVGSVANGGAFLLQNSNNSTNAFQIQNAAGWQLFNIDSNYTGLISNPGFEIDTSGWNVRAGGTLTRTTAQNYYGVASGQIVMTNTTGAGAYFPVALAASTQYTVSAYVRGLTAATAGLITIGFQNTLGTDGTCTASSFPAVTTTGWTRMTCTFTTAAAVPSTDIYVKQTTAVARTIYVDAFKVEAGAVATPYSFSNISMRGTITNPLSLRNTSDSTTEFQIANAAGATIFSVDSLNNTVGLGSGATGTIVTVDLAGTTTAHGVCHSGAAGAGENLQLVACNGFAQADYAELYPSQPDVSPGDIVQTTPVYATSKDGKYSVPFLAKTTGQYDAKLTGVISESEVNSDEAVVIGHNVADSDHPMPLALNGRVLTNVSTENGEIKAGDYITASSVAGVGMKATHAGEVVGKALGDYSGAGVGKILVFINPIYYSADQATTGSGAIVSPSLTSDGALQITSGTTGDVTIDSGNSDGHITIGALHAAAVDISKAGATTTVKGDLVTQGKAAFNNGLDLHFTTPETSFTVDNTGSVEPIAAAITVTDNGSGYTKLIQTPNFTVGGNGDVETNGNIVSKSGSFQIVDPSGHQVIGFDSTGSANIAGNLNVASASLSGGLQVGGDVQVAGLSTFEKLATFLGKTIFRQDVQFDGHVTVAKDGAGYAALRTGETTIHVAFQNDYTTPPIVSATITNGTFAAYTTDHVTVHGFDITLKQPATEQTNFSWTAIGVNDPQTATNPLPTTP